VFGFAPGLFEDREPLLVLLVGLQGRAASRAEEVVI